MNDSFFMSMRFEAAVMWQLSVSPNVQYVLLQVIEVPVLIQQIQWEAHYLCDN